MVQVSDPVPHLTLSLEAQAHYGGSLSYESPKMSIPPGLGEFASKPDPWQRGLRIWAIGGPTTLLSKPCLGQEEGLGAATTAALRGRDPALEAGGVCQAPTAGRALGSHRSAEVAQSQGLDYGEDTCHQVPAFLLPTSKCWKPIVLRFSRK